jgi:hypothetical protein
MVFWVEGFAYLLAGWIHRQNLGFLFCQHRSEPGFCWQHGFIGKSRFCKGEGSFPTGNLLAGWIHRKNRAFRGLGPSLKKKFDCVLSQLRQDVSAPENTNRFLKTVPRRQACISTVALIDSTSSNMCVWRFLKIVKVCSRPKFAQDSGSGLRSGRVFGSMLFFLKLDKNKSPTPARPQKAVFWKIYP